MRDETTVKVTTVQCLNCHVATSPKETACRSCGKDRRYAPKVVTAPTQLAFRFRRKREVVDYLGASAS